MKYLSCLLVCFSGVMYAAQAPGRVNSEFIGIRCYNNQADAKNKVMEIDVVTIPLTDTMSLDDIQLICRTKHNIGYLTFADKKIADLDLADRQKPVTRILREWGIDLKTFMEFLAFVKK